MRRLIHFAAIGANGVSRMVVGENEHDVRPLRSAEDGRGEEEQKAESHGRDFANGNG